VQCDTARPGFFDWKGRAKWDAWNNLGAMDKTEAMTEYVGLLHDQVPGWDRGGKAGGGNPMGPVCSTIAGAMDREEEGLADDAGSIWEALRAGDEAAALAVLAGLGAGERDARDPDGRGCTALHMAADAGLLGVVTALLGRGWDANAADEEGMTPLHCAAVCGHEACARALVGGGADVGAPDSDGSTPAECAPASWAWMAAPTG